MSAFSTQFEADALSLFKVGSTGAGSSQTFLALYESGSPPADDGTGGTECTGSGYARIAVTFGSPVVSGGSTISNTGAIVFTATGTWNPVQSYGYWRTSSGSTGTNYLGGGTLSAAKTLANTDTLTFAIGALTVKID